MGYEFTEPALAQFRQLEFWLAEETLDELEIVAHASLSPGLKSPTGLVHDFVRVRAGVSFYVFLTIVPDAATDVRRVTAVGLYVRKPTE